MVVIDGNADLVVVDGGCIGKVVSPAQMLL